MSDIFFILTVIYAAYVIYQGIEKSSITKTIPLVKTKKNSITENKNIQQSFIQPSTQKIELRTVLMKNPKTGEHAKVANNYRMVKRWIKEALVEEKLLNKIYKNNELNNDSKLIIAEALSIIKAMDKYKV